ncbi:hypothetical protein PHYBOEH_010191 [Phytophthora boehmeriae]|uniref:Uncharacterized protein n=1 Tax=Phytophthora boehmeriae TaxID=109152 RepID=A0A8T1WY80_9STRA|nr:hypothetical protein PHYBOEH_010191 [Phytophthora boehmeriae]
MNLFLILVPGLLAATLLHIDATIIDHDKVQPFAQPEPVTISEKAGVMFKPTLNIHSGCHSFPAVNAEGETTGGLKPTGDTEGCRDAPLGSQVYGRGAWYQDYWAIMYSWYYPKGYWASFTTRRHDWSCAILWIDNPEFETPTIKGISTCHGDSSFDTIAPPGRFSTRFYHGIFPLFGGAFTDWTSLTGDSQDLIMWDQLTDAARAALNTTDFGNAKVPFNDENFEKKLKKAWPF